MPNVVVTGGCGFIGSHLVDLLLAHHYHVTVVDNFSTGRPQNLAHHQGNDQLEIISADINQPELYEAAVAQCQYLFHLAALADIVPSIEQPADYHRANVEGTLQILLLAQKYSQNIKKVVYAASSSCYGIPHHYPTPESWATAPQYPYALTKYVAEQYLQHWGQVYQVPTISLRLFNVYGPRARTNGTYGAVFGVFLKQLLAQCPFTVVGDGTQRRDFTYVTDVARAFLMAALSPHTRQIYNVGSGQPHSVNELMELLQPQAPKVYLPKRPGEPDITHADIKKIQADLGWAPQVTFAQGVQKTKEAIAYWQDAPLWDAQSIATATQTWFKYLR